MESENISLYFKQTNFGHFCLIENDLISNCISDYGFWEIHLHNIYSKLIKKDSIIVDGGANIGFHSIQFAKLASEGRVYSFEPQALIHNVLSTNILINGLSRKIHQYRCGLSDGYSKHFLTNISNHDITMDNCINWGGRGFLEGDGDEEAYVIPLDSLELSKLDFIKLDVQGFEYKTLMGGINTIKANTPYVLIENYNNRLDDNGEEKEKAPIELLLSLGYTGYRLLMGNNEDCIFTIDSQIETLLKKLSYNYDIIK